MNNTHCRRHDARSRIRACTEEERECDVERESHRLGRERVTHKKGCGAMSFGTGCKFQSYSLVVHSGVGGSGAAEMRMNGLRDDPPTRERRPPCRRR